MSEPLLLVGGRPRGFRIIRWCLALLAIFAMVCAPIALLHKTWLILLLAAVGCLERRYQSQLRSHSTVLIHRNGLIKVYSHAVARTAHLSACAWLSRSLCVLQVEFSDGSVRQLCLFAAVNHPLQWRRLLILLRTHTGHASEPGLVC